MSLAPTLSRAAQTAANWATARSAYAVMVADNGEPTETEPRRFGFATPEFDATAKLSEATERTRQAVALLVERGLARMGTDEWGEVLELLVEPEELA